MTIKERNPLSLCAEIGVFDSSSASNSNGKQIANELYGDTSIFLSKMNPECFVVAARPNFMKAAPASNISYIQRVDRETLLG